MSLRADGKVIILGGNQQIGTLFWDLDPQHWVEAACQLGRSLSRDEWESNVASLDNYRPICPESPPTSDRSFAGAGARLELVAVFDDQGRGVPIHLGSDSGV